MRSHTFRGLAVGAAAVLAMAGSALVMPGAAHADEDECLQVLGQEVGDGEDDGDGTGEDNGDENGYESACQQGADGNYEQCLAQLMYIGGVGPIDATLACSAAHEDNGGEDGQGGGGSPSR